MVAALPVNHRLAQASRSRMLRLNDLAGDVFVAYPPGPGAGLYDALRSACRANGFAPVMGYEAPQMIGTLSLVGAGKPPLKHSGKLLRIFCSPVHKIQ